MDNCVTRAFDRTAERLWSLKRPLLTIIVIGLILRLILSTLTFAYDAEYWMLVIRNIKMGEGLYGVSGYYYTPVWGYLLGLLSEFQSLFLQIGEMGVKVVEFATVENKGFGFKTSIIASLAMVYCIKMPLAICDIILSFLAYALAKEFGADEKKATLVFGLVFLCPILMYTSQINMMPDIISAIFMMLCILMLKRQHNLLGGVCLCMAILTKFFPVFLFFPLVAYVLATNKGNTKKMYTELGLAALGFAGFALVIFMPQILDGTIVKCFSFITDRLTVSPDDIGTVAYALSDSMILGNVESAEYLDFKGFVDKIRVISYILVLIASVVLAVRLYRTEKDDLDNKMIRCCFVMMLFCMMFPPAEQYLCVLVPLLAFWIVMRDKKMIAGWAILFVSTFVMCLSSNAMLLLPWATDTNLVSVDSLWNVYSFFAAGDGLFNIMNIQFFIGSVLQYAGIFLVFWAMYGEYIKTSVNNRRA